MASHVMGCGYAGLEGGEVIIFHAEGFQPKKREREKEVNRHDTIRITMINAWIRSMHFPTIFRQFTNWVGGGGGAMKSQAQGYTRKLDTMPSGIRATGVGRVLSSRLAIGLFENSFWQATFLDCPSNAS